MPLFSYKSRRTSLLHVLAVLLTIIAFPGLWKPGHAASSEWQDLGGGKARLVAVENPETGVISGAIEVHLSPGWKTYWRTPGDSGIPPQFDFSGSSGFVAGEVHFPAPHRIAIGEVIFAGYRDRVLFPFSGKRLASSGAIDLGLFIGVCEEVCIPAKADFTIAFASLATSSFVDAGIINEAKSGLPGRDSLSSKLESLNADEDSGRLAVTLSISDGIATWNGKRDTAQLFVEGPSGTWFEPVLATNITGPDTQDGYRINFDIPYEAKAGTVFDQAVLLLTLRLGSQATEISKTVAN